MEKSLNQPILSNQTKYNMDKFSVFNYVNLSGELKIFFNKALAQKLSSLLCEIKNDDVLGSSAVEEFVSSLGESVNAASLVSFLYTSVSGGIQSGSGNQNLLHSVLYAFSESWEECNN